MQVYEYDRNLLQQDAVQYIAAYKYELGTILAALNMCQFVRQRPRITDKQSSLTTASSTGDLNALSGSFSGAGSGGGAPLIPKPGSGKGRPAMGRSPQHRNLPGAGGFSITAVLSAVRKEGDKGRPCKICNSSLHNASIVYGWQLVYVVLEGVL